MIALLPSLARYDDLKSAQDNMDLQSTILSRFDLIFIVKDPATEERDAAIARKVRERPAKGALGAVVVGTHAAGDGSPCRRRAGGCVGRGARATGGRHRVAEGVPPCGKRAEGAERGGRCSSFDVRCVRAVRCVRGVQVLENHRTAGAVRPLVPTGPTVADEAAQVRPATRAH